MIKEKSKNKNYSLLIGFLLILFGLSLIFVDWYKEYQKVKVDEKLVETFFDDRNIVEEKLIEEKEEKKIEKQTVEEKYIAILEIPKISLKRGLVSTKSNKNNVDYNIQIISSSNTPDKEKGNFILAGHSGSGYSAFFKNLDKLQIDDYSYVYYENQKYIYKVVNIYEVEKTGVVEIRRNYDKTTLTLITCTKGDDTKQTVIISELVNKEYIGRNNE